MVTHSKITGRAHKQDLPKLWKQGPSANITNSKTAHSHISGSGRKPRLHLSRTMAKSDTALNNLFSSLIEDIKSYSGTDHLLPWLRGIKKMKDSLPSNLLKEKLPRFLQKCTQSFESDRRYKNDTRYLRVWLELMDYVDDPKGVLRTMEVNRIGTKRSLFYQAYALYYEKMKKFEEAEKMYHLGVQNLAEPADELQKSYEQFLQRMERHKMKRIRQMERRTSRRPLSARSNTVHSNDAGEISENIGNVEGRPARAWDNGSLPEKLPFDRNAENKKILKESMQNSKQLIEPNHVGQSGRCMYMQQVVAKRVSDEPRMFAGDDTVVVKFVDTAIVGKSEVEDACHHGLVDPTINLKEAMNAINSMFRDPIDTAPIGRKSNRGQGKEIHGLEKGFEVFIDQNLDKEIKSSERKEEKGLSVLQHGRVQICQPHQELFKIFVDDEEGDEVGGRNNEKENLNEAQNLSQGSSSSPSHVNGFVFPSPKDLPSESSDDMDAENSPQVKLREDTVVHRFVGSTISDEPQVENVCHHGLVDPTINLKEAMHDINNMFGKPIDFVRTKRPKKQKAPVRHKDPGGFLILPDDDLEPQRLAPTKSSSKSDRDLFEPTMFTKEAMDEINKMFGMPL